MWRRVLVKSLPFCGYVCIVYCTHEFVGDFVVCSGPSMEPHIRTGDIVLTDHLSVRFNRIQRGDIVIAKSPSNPNGYICKRIKLLQGDQILKQPESSFHNRSYVPKGHVWIEGDNKQNSNDSRRYGPIPYGLLRSRVFFRVWPMGKFGFMGRETVVIAAEDR